MSKIIFLILLTLMSCGCVRRGEHKALINPITEPPIITELTSNNNVVITINVIKDTISDKEIYNLFKVSNVVLSDATYWKPSKEWVLNNVYPYYFNFLEGQGVSYGDHFDCDDFARTFCVMAQLYFYKYEEEHRGESPAIAEIHYQPDPKPGTLGFFLFTGGKHAINAIVIDDGSIMFLEPQSGKQIFLSDHEKKSIYFVKF